MPRLRPDAVVWFPAYFRAAPAKHRQRHGTIDTVFVALAVEVAAPENL